MRAIESLLAGLIDYAGLYPPASLDMESAVRNYLNHAQSKHAAALGRFVVDLDRLPEFRESAGDSMRLIRLSAITSANAEWNRLQNCFNEGFRIGAIETKDIRPAEIERIAKCIPTGVVVYFEIPIDACTVEALAMISGSGGRVKLRMGGVTAEAFPSIEEIARALKNLAASRISFKATAGLHHAVRSRHPFTYAPNSAIGTMHGFMNLVCAAAFIHFGGEMDSAKEILGEEDPGAWTITSDEVSWRSLRWSAAQLRTVREGFLISFGSCSLDEPLHDLEALGWL